MISGLEIARLNYDINQTSADINIRRYILISSGNAIVGNIGGMDSSIEITALGPPVNFLSRLDDATKAESFSAVLNNRDLLIGRSAREELAIVTTDLKFEKIELDDIGVSIRDFPEEKVVYRLKPTDTNYSRAIKAYESYQEPENVRGGRTLYTVSG